MLKIVEFEINDLKFNAIKTTVKKDLFIYLIISFQFK